VAHPVPAGFSLRPVSLEDAPTIADVINECTIAEIGLPWITEKEMRDDLTSPGRDATDLDALVVDQHGAAAGYLQLWGDIPPYNELFALPSVKSGFWGRGLSRYLLELAEERARARIPRAPETARVVLQAARFLGNEAAERLFRILGYAPVRTFFQMRIDLAEPPPAPLEVSGIEIRSFDPAHDAEPAYAALAEAFQDHWGHVFPPYEQWRHAHIDGEGAGFDPELWFVAMDRGQVVGAACCRASTARDPDAGEVNILGVRRDWRRRGIGLALLSSAFVRFCERSIRAAELGVDGENETGATRLYRRAGMRTAYGWEVWEKELRPAGRSEQEQGG
jgi:mycothiol synthase